MFKQNFLETERLCLCFLLFVIFSSNVFSNESHFWGLGVGTYGIPNKGDFKLDWARYDWVTINFGNVPENLKTINICNQLLEINPNLKFLVRLWPISNLGRPENNNAACFLDYFYKQGTKQQVLERIANQLSLVLDNISSPQNVVAITFLEELPGWWGYSKKILFRESALEVLEPYKEDIEFERGKPLEYDEELVQWLGDKYVQSLAEIHSYIRQLADDRLILYWQVTNIITLDLDPAGYPYFYGDIIVKGQLADGLMLYPLNAQHWQNQLNLAIENDWYFFSQLSHPSLMRQTDWKSALELVKVEHPNNLGYFFYCAGNCRRPHWYDDQTVLPINNIRDVSIPIHMRQFARQQNVGQDIIERGLRFEPMLDINVKEIKVGEMIEIYSVIPNPRLEGYFEREQEIVDEVWAKLSLPSGLELVEGFYQKVRVGDLASRKSLATSYDSFGIAYWQVQVAGEVKITDDNNLSIFVCSKDSNLQNSVRINELKNNLLPFFQPQKLQISGQSWGEPGFRLSQDLKPVVLIETFEEAVKNPSITNGEYEIDAYIGTWEDNAGYFKLTPKNQLTTWSERIVYCGILPPFSRLEIYNDKSAKLFKKHLYEEYFKNPEDPTGYQSFSTGYIVKSINLNQRLESNIPLRINISGKAIEGANSLVVLRFKDNDTGEIRDTSILVNKFTNTWKEDCNEVISPPFEDTTLVAVYLYRYNKVGTIWYGEIIISTDPHPEPQDVSPNLAGEIPTIYKGKYNIITYFDENEQQPKGTKTIVQLNSP